MFDQKQVVIVGGGFAGIHCAERLCREPDFSITIIDRHNYQQFQPLLYQVAIGALSTQNAAFNLHAMFEDFSNVQVKTSTIGLIDINHKVAVGERGDRYEGDYLVLAAGSQPNFFGVKGAVEFTYPMYSLRDAERLRPKLYGVLEDADLLPSQIPEEGVSIVVIGGGPTGIETAGAIADLLRLIPEKIYRNLDPSKVSVTLVSAGSTLLGAFSSTSQQYTRSELEKRGVRLHFGPAVTEITQNSVIFADGSSLAASLAIWAGGLKASGLAQTSGMPTGPGGRINVDEDLTVLDNPRIYALGDFANCKGADGVSLPQLASVAQQAGRHCAANIIADARGEERKPFRYVDKGIMAMIGRNASVAELGSHHVPIHGPFAYAAWLGVHAALLTSFRAELESLVEWTWDYAREGPMNPLR